MPEFVNPKYKDATKTTFKSPARLECMMQDYPKSLPTGEHVGFSVITATTSFSPVKTNLSDARAKSRGGMPTYSAPSGEADVYASNCELLAAAGVSLPAAAPVERGGIRLADSPRVVVDPSFGVGVAAWRAKFPTPRWVSIAAGSTLVLRGRLEGLSIEKLDLAGALVIEVCEGATVTVKSLVERNAGWAFVELVDGEDAPEELAIRGYRLEKRAERTQLEWPESVQRKRFDGRDHTLTVLSSDAVMSWRESSEKETERTAPECPLSSVDSPRAFGSHSRTVRSFDAEAMSSPVGENSAW